jgi:serine/threonine-protein kinase
LPKIARRLKLFREFKHDSVVPIVHIGASGDRQYLAWPFVAVGDTLIERVERQGSLPLEQSQRLALQAAAGLPTCHEHGLFHGLLKPSNIVITPEGKVRMLGFGIGLMLSLGRDESLIDTLNTHEQLADGIDCGAPESLLDQTNRTPASDQYSLGCVLYFCLTGQFPFSKGSYVQNVMAHQDQEPTPVRELNPAVPGWLEAVVKRLMRKQPDERYPSMRDAVEALKGKRSAAATQVVCRLEKPTPNGPAKHRKPAARPTPTRPLTPTTTINPTANPPKPTEEGRRQGSIPWSGPGSLGSSAWVASLPGGFSPER